ncbi:hypothetical protein MBLNU230_g3605t1 [Neophaeotheca triangularis]
MSQEAPFHNLLSFYSNRTPHPNTQTIRLTDSLTGNLSLGLDFPVALAIAIGRHLTLRNTSLLSLDIHVPSVPTKKTLLDGIPVDEKASYSASEMWKLGGQNGWSGSLDAVGLWALAAGVGSGRVEGRDVVSFQRGTLLEDVRRRRRVGRGEVLPLWRGGPISVAGHSWFVQRLFGVDVYRVEGKGD